MTTLITFNKKKKLGVAYIPSKKIIRKFTFDKTRYKLIKNESKGHSWYHLQRKKILKTSKSLITVNKSYIETPIILGNKRKFWNYLEKNYDESISVIEHYKKIWPNKKITPCHGDLTFSNIIFDRNNIPIIVDWENFLSRKMQWGYDLSYFLISTVSLPSIFYKDTKIRNKELLLPEKLWKVAFKSKKYQYLNKPVNFIKRNFGRTFILRDRSDYFPNLLSKHKIDQINEVLKFNF